MPAKNETEEKGIYSLDLDECRKKPNFVTNKNINQQYN